MAAVGDGQRTCGVAKAYGVSDARRAGLTGAACGDRSGFAGLSATGLEEVLGGIFFAAFGFENGLVCATPNPLNKRNADRSA